MQPLQSVSKFSRELNSQCLFKTEKSIIFLMNEKPYLVVRIDCGDQNATR